MLLVFYFVNIWPIFARHFYIYLSWNTILKKLCVSGSCVLMLKLRILYVESILSLNLLQHQLSRCVIYYLQLVLTNHFQYNSISQSYIICRFENQVLLISNDSEIFGIIRSLCKNVGYTLCLVYIIASVPQAESNTNTSKLIEAPG